MPFGKLMASSWQAEMLDSVNRELYELSEFGKEAGKVFGKLRAG